MTVTNAFGRFLPFLGHIRRMRVDALSAPVTRWIVSTTRVRVGAGPVSAPGSACHWSPNPPSRIWSACATLGCRWVMSESAATRRSGNYSSRQPGQNIVSQRFQRMRELHFRGRSVNRQRTSRNATSEELFRGSQRSV